MYKNIQILAFILLVVGGLNWGLIGLFGFDLVARLFGEMTYLTRAVYTLVGISAVFILTTASASGRKE